MRELTGQEDGNVMMEGGVSEGKSKKIPANW